MVDNRNRKNSNPSSRNKASNIEVNDWITAADDKADKFYDTNTGRFRKRRRDDPYAYIHRRLKELRKRHLTGAVAAAALVILLGLGVAIGFAVRKDGSDQGDTAVTMAENDTQSETESGTAVGETDITQEPLQKDAVPEINTLAAGYYEALGSGDIASLQTMVDHTSEAELILFEKESEVISSYGTITAYTKPGMTEGAYVVYIQYETKFKEADTPLPGLEIKYADRNEQGQYIFIDSEQNAEIAAYMSQVSLQEDVVTLKAQIQENYDGLVAGNPDLAVFVETVEKELKVQVGEELLARQEAAKQQEESLAAESDSAQADGESAEGQTADAGAAASGTSAEGNQSSASQSGSSSFAGSSTSVPNSGEYAVQETVNVRKRASETSDKIGVCYQGEKLEILMKQADGWTKVKFKGQTGYVKSDVLK